MRAIRVLMMERSPHFYGSNRYLFYRMKWIDPVKYAPILFTCDEGPLTDMARKNGFEVLVLKLPPIIDKYNKELFEYAVFKKLQAAIFLLIYNLKVYLSVRNKRIDLIHINNSRSIGYFGLSAILLNKPIIWHIQNDMAVPMSIRKFGLLISKRVVLAGGLEVAKKIFTRSETKNYHDKLIAIFDGIDPGRLSGGTNTSSLERELGIKNGTKIITTITLLEERKGHTYFLDMALRLKQDYDNLLFLIVGNSGVGDEQYAKNLREQIKGQGLEEDVKLMGWRDDVPAILSLTKVFVLASLNEMFPNVLLEAMVTGVPIVSTEVGGIPYMLDYGRAGSLVPTRDGNALALSVKKLLDDPGYASSLAKIGTKRVLEEFTLKQHAARIEALYESLVLDM